MDTSSLNTLIASALKTNSITINDEETSVFIGYDYSVIDSHNELCNANVNMLADHWFQIGAVWRDRSLIRSAAHAFTSLLGFTVLNTSEYIRCSRYGQRHYLKGNGSVGGLGQCQAISSSRRNIQGGHLSCNCTSSFSLKSTKTTKTLTKKPSQVSKPKYRDSWEDGVPVVIKKAYCKYSGL